MQRDRHSITMTPLELDERIAAARSDLEAQLAAAKAEVAELRDDRLRALKRAHDVTHETQTCDEAVADLIRIVTLHRGQRDASESAHAETRKERGEAIRMLSMAETREAETWLMVEALLGTLPKCDSHPDRPATRAFTRGGAQFCDECGGAHGLCGLVPEYSRAAPLRALLAARAKRGDSR